MSEPAPPPQPAGLFPFTDRDISLIRFAARQQLVCSACGPASAHIHWRPGAVDPHARACGGVVTVDATREPVASTSVGDVLLKHSGRDDVVDVYLFPKVWLSDVPLPDAPIARLDRVCVGEAALLVRLAHLAELYDDAATAGDAHADALRGLTLAVSDRDAALAAVDVDAVRAYLTARDWRRRDLPGSDALEHWHRTGAVAPVHLALATPELGAAFRPRLWDMTLAALGMLESRHPTVILGDWVTASETRRRLAPPTPKAAARKGVS